MKKNLLSKDVSFFQPSLNDKAEFFRDLSIMINSGFSIIEALGILAEQGPKKMRTLSQEIAEKIEVGSSFSDTIKEYKKIFSVFHINIIKAGESSGTLEESFANLSKELLKQASLREKIKTAMFYPSIVLFLSLVLGFGMTYFVLPNLTKIFIGMDVELPLSTRFLIWFTDFSQENVGLILVCFVLFFVFVNYFFKKDFLKPITHKLLMKIPFVKDIVIYKNLSDMSRSMSILIKSGLSFFDALLTTEKIVGNYYYKRVIKEAKDKVSEGMKLSDVLVKHEKMFPGMAIGMVKIGEKSGKLEDQFSRLGSLYEDEISKRVAKIAVIIEPVLLVLIGLVVGGLALSIITPIYKITGNISY